MYKDLRLPTFIVYQNINSYIAKYKKNPGISELARFMNKEKTATLHIVHTLVEKGYVELIQDTKDKKIKRIKVIKTGD